MILEISGKIYFKSKMRFKYLVLIFCLKNELYLFLSAYLEIFKLCGYF